ncbi:hypothetical protein [Paraflavitalea sp. CAU 1676]|uniref:hypothetical protein n=1 Tax=Paraflavitalea sp. CAU 1676 TaxID=3032598 RepID=UPI0023D9E2B1|nr:hypothetical protein [Paraflavitalea sp. CAU 1676]MDF2191280.1 hypothetical protein [Paraflavitalea sp. CAU 1676]
MAHTREYIIQLLTNGTHKTWYKTGKVPVAGCMPGDEQIHISKDEMKLTISICNDMLEWEEKSTHCWSVQFDPMTEQLKLTIDGQFCRYSYDPKGRYLTLKIPQGAEPIILQ